MTTDKDIAYIELTFPKHIKEYLHNLVKDLVPFPYFYYSEVLMHINGDVTSNTHLSLFFGLDPELANNSELNRLIADFKIQDIELGNLFFIEGFRGLYKVLCIEVFDKQRHLLDFVNKVEDEFSFNNGTHHRTFRPHITLAYVNNDYKLPQNLPKIIEKAQGESVRFAIFRN